MAKLCYAIRKGRRPGIVYSWDACKESVDGFRGAEYKGFDSEVEALEYLNGKDFPTNKASKPKEKIDKTIKTKTFLTFLFILVFLIYV